MSDFILPEKSGSLCLVFDIGTTNIKTVLCRAPEDDDPMPYNVRAWLEAGRGEKNNQSVFGTDVVSRILSAHHNGVEPLRKKIADQLQETMCRMCEGAVYSMEDLSGIIITGNTVMLHLLRGLSVQGFEMAPFTPVTTDAAEMRWGELIPEADKHGSPTYPAADLPVFIPPCIDAFIGADAVCAALYAMTERRVGTESTRITPKYPLILADIGTNTEIVMISSAASKKGGQDAFKITCCSTAAGPAFEGGVLGGKYTGSELIHMLAGLLESGAMDETGLLKDEPAACLENIQKSGAPVITQDAVRQLQLAKAAVCAAIETLLQEENLTVSDIGSFVLCGNFGNAVSAQEAARIGLIPAGFADITLYAENAAELGARLLMLDEMREKAKKIAASGKLIQLADSRFFARRYIERMNF